jgi:4-hydroxybenzoyl-CoA thioesterase
MSQKPIAFRYERLVRFAEVDSARVVFFARFLEYCHEALEALFESLPGGYPHLTMIRDIGIPTVHIEIDYLVPLRYGDTAIVEAEVTQIGRTSVSFRHTIRRQSDGQVCAHVAHVVVVVVMSAMKPMEIPTDMRSALLRYVSSPA